MNDNAQVAVTDSRFTTVEQQLDKMKDRAGEFAQTRSNFMIEKFIGCDEYTPITKFRHLAHNSYVTMQEARRLIIDQEKKSRKITKLNKKLEDAKGSADPTAEDADLELYELSRQMEEQEIRIKGLLKEVDYMEHLCEELEKKNGKPFTSEQFQAEEPEYWRKRFANQMLRAVEGGKTGVGEGNLMSLWMAEEEPIAADSKNKINPFNFHDIDQIATIAFESREGLNDLYLKPAQPDLKKLPKGS